MKFICG